MSNLDLYKVDLDTPQPNGRQGESPRSAFTKHNDLIEALKGGMVDVISSTAPGPAPYVTWVDTSVTPPMIRRRNEANTQWVTIGPALTPFGSAAYLDAIGTAPLYGRDSVVGQVGLSNDIPTGALWQIIANSNGIALRNAAGIQICVRSELVTTVVAMPVGALFYTGDYVSSRPFPAPFSSTPEFADLRIAAGAASIVGGGHHDGTTASWPPFVHYSDVSRTSAATYRYHWLAIGRWNG